MQDTGFTLIPIDLSDDWMACFDGNHLKVLHIIARETLGRERESAELTLNHLSTKTELSARWIKTALFGQGGLIAQGRVKCSEQAPSNGQIARSFALELKPLGRTDKA